MLNESDWDDVDTDVYLKWDRATQLKYCALRDQHFSKVWEERDNLFMKEWFEKMSEEHFRNLHKINEQELGVRIDGRE